MPPSLAMAICTVFIVYLLSFDFRTPPPRPSLALWLPLTWLAIAASRLPSQWFGGQVSIDAAASADGNVLDRVIYLSLIVLGILVLFNRRFNLKKFIFDNVFLFFIITFCFFSVFWSDFLFISFKRWLRDLGGYIALLVALSEVHPAEAVMRLLRRFFIILIPMSFVLCKYYPEIGKQFDYWTGRPYFVGVTTSKNMLGVLCLISGLFFLWKIFYQIRGTGFSKSKLEVIQDFLLLSMSVWLLILADSQTSAICLVLGGSIIFVSNSKLVRRQPVILVFIIPISLGFYLLLQFGLGIDLIALLAEAVGRDPDLTGRTHIWNVVLSTNINPLIGAGYESFWLGPRLEWVWERAGPINHAHNGYIEAYLNIGIIGVLLIIIFLMISYVKIYRSFLLDPVYSSLSLSLWVVLIFYNLTEVAFRGHLLWSTFLLLVIVVPSRGKRLPAPMAVSKEARVGSLQKSPLLRKRP